METDIYKRLRKHMDSMPVGFPKTKTGVELRLLKRFFTPEEARLALQLDYRYRTQEEVQAVMDPGTDVPGILERMAGKGAIMKKYREGQPVYALGPYVIGIYEMQAGRLSKELLDESNEFFHQGFGLEYLTTPVPQMRVIPVERSITEDHMVATYDEIRSLIRQAGSRVAIGECICKKAAGLNGKECRTTSRREVCMCLRDFSDVMLEQGWGRRITQQEAMELLDLAEKEGLVLQPANQQEPQFVCACCSCCCGILKLAKVMKKPADFLASNFRAEIDTEKCNACGLCVSRCQMEAISVNGKAAIDRNRCIGCGLCVTVCKPAALKLKKKEKETVPPKTDEDLYGYLMDHKRSKAGKLIRGIRGMTGM